MTLKKLLTNKLKSLSLNDHVWRIIVTNRVFDMNFYSLCRHQPEHGAELWRVNKAPDSVWAEDKELFVFALSLKIKLLSSQNKTILSSRTRAGLTTGLNSRSPEICRLTVCQPTPASLSTRRSRRKYTVKQQSCKKSQIIKHVPMRRCDDELIYTTSCLTLFTDLRSDFLHQAAGCWKPEARLLAVAVMLTLTPRGNNYISRLPSMHCVRDPPVYDLNKTYEMNLL